MRRGRPPKPIISIESVTAALKSLDYSVQSQSNDYALENLQLIDFHLQNNRRPSAENIRAWMLRKILADYIITATNQHRIYFNLSPLSTNNSREIEIRACTHLPQLASESLSGWSILYLRYLRPELSFTIQELSDLLHVNERTVRRYQDSAVYQLRDLLIESEAEARQLQHQSYLMTKIPERMIELIGRDTEQTAILSHLKQQFKLPILISGTEGIGKSSICAIVVRKLIQQQNIDYLLWIRHPDSVEDIRNKIWDTILPYKTQRHWRETIAHQHFIVIIDGIDKLLATLDDFNELLIELQDASILLTSHSDVVSLQTYHVPLRPLNDFAGTKIIRNFSGQQISSDETQDILSSTFGNPRRIIESCQNLLTNYESSAQIISKSSEQEFENLSQEDKVVALLCTFEKDGVDIDTIKSVVHWKAGESKLVRKNILIVNNDYFYLPPTFIKYIQMRCSVDTEATSLGNEILRKMLKVVQKDANISSFLLSCISAGWFNFDKGIILQTLEEIDLKQLSTGKILKWRNIYLLQFGLDNQSDAETSYLRYKYGIVLRCTYHTDTEQYLSDLIQEFGNEGQFKLQGLVLYELALLYQQTALFEKALDIYNYIQQSLKNHMSDDLLESLNIQLAEIELVRQNSENALAFLEGYDVNKPENFVLFCEAHLVSNNFDFVIDAVQNYLANDISEKVSARLHTILGRCYQQIQRHTEALVQFNEALSITQLDSDQVDIARAQTNLGSSYLMTIETQPNVILDEIEDLFIETKKLQLQIKDFVGLEASTRNLNYLQQYRIRNYG